MKLIPTQLFPRLAKTASGMTLTELMVAVSIGFIVLMFMSVVFADSARCFAATGNYVSMDCSSRNALDRMTREIRGADTLTECTATKLKFTSYGSTNGFLVYEWDANSRQLTECWTGTSRTNILLTGCDEFAFSMQTAALAPTANVAQGKAIGVNWKCSRTVLGKKINTEDMQQALIVICNKPL